MSDEDSVTPSVQYVYKTVNANNSTFGGPMFILLYIQCAMFMISAAMNLTIELWQLVFPTFVVVLTFTAGMLNQSRA